MNARRPRRHAPMSGEDVRGILILPLLAVLFFFVGDGMVLPAALSGVALGWCLVERHTND